MIHRATQFPPKTPDPLYSQLFVASRRGILHLIHNPPLTFHASMVAQAADPRAWSATTVDDTKRWYFPLSLRLLNDLRGVIAAQPADKPITEILLTDKQRSQWSE